MSDFFSKFLNFGSVSAGDFLLALGAAVVLGLVISFTYIKTGEYSGNFAKTLVVLPVLVCVVIMLVNGSLGASVAILGAFSLVRFRSIPGTSKEIMYIFFAMVIGLLTSMGFALWGAVFTVLMCVIILILEKTRYGGHRQAEKELRITIPESLDYNGIFDDLFTSYTKGARLKRVKTSNMGSMYELFYDVVITDETKEKEMIDAIRCRNGNLNIILGQKDRQLAEL